MAKSHAVLIFYKIPLPYCFDILKVQQTSHSCLLLQELLETLLIDVTHLTATTTKCKVM